MQTLLLTSISLILYASVCCSQQLENQPLSLANCPLWFQYNESLHDCQCLPDLLMCKGQDMIMKSDYISTYDENKKIITLSPIASDCKLFNEITKPPGYVLLPRNLSKLNEYMCGPLNRKSYLCRECVQGYGLAITTARCANKCYDCTGRSIIHHLMLYVIVEFVPLTLFYLFILIFRVSFTSAPMTCFLFYSQMIVVVFNYLWEEDLLLTIFYTESGDLRSMSKLILVLYGIFNLDSLFHAFPPFCISTHLKPVYRNLLGYTSAFYPLFLIFWTWFCIKLHDNNFKPLVILWNPLHRYFVRLRRGWNTRNDLIDVFASFFLLSYCKITYQALLMLSAGRNYHYSTKNGYISESYVLLYDNTVTTSSSLYSILAGFAGLILFLNNLPIIALTFYPLKLFKRALSLCRLDGYALIIFVEKFHSCYQNGLGGAKDMRSFSGLYFLLRVLISVGTQLPYQLNFEPWFSRGALLSITAMAIALCRPYKKSYMNISDTLLLLHMALMCHLLSSNTENLLFVPFMQTMLLIPFAIFTIYILYRIVRGLCTSTLRKSFLFQHCLKKDSDACTRQELNQRVITYGAIPS